MVTSTELLPKTMTPEEIAREVAWHTEAAAKARAAGDEANALKHEEVIATQLTPRKS